MAARVPGGEGRYRIPTWGEERPIAIIAQAQPAEGSGYARWRKGMPASAGRWSYICVAAGEVNAYLALVNANAVQALKRANHRTARKGDLIRGAAGAPTYVVTDVDGETVLVAEVI